MKLSSGHSSFVRASYLVLMVSILVGAIAIPLYPMFALLPLAMVFGWSQISGL
jgi:hypothetical protein